MGSFFSRPLTAQVDASVLRGAELYERVLRTASHFLSLFFVPLLNSPFSLSNYARSRRQQQHPYTHRYPCGEAEEATAHAGLSPTLPHQDIVGPGRFCQHSRLAELTSHNALRRVQSNASRNSRTSRYGGDGGPAGTVSVDAYHSPYSLAGMKANRETIQRRRARAELAAAGVDVQLLRRNSGRAAAPSPQQQQYSTAIAPSITEKHHDAHSITKRRSAPVRSALTPALEPTPRMPPVRRPSRRREAI
ncbi:unnamed protein product [Tilletia controversa]|uniref:Uncharacterized protein n=3 Tax=Tilletia TaxID=13289 RepID=A0A8X7SW46_9BASI|nr:hypothetical protein CF336_g4701 [Tilletia laevis]KAE8194370.1 hypothetical protein CF328_g4769 [Tilletia controversa]KAE8257000.1 hypothetical protein A4X03_0g4844 [Tilletia caries]KAE8196110.1 hypothetical protein CF335_g4941 [Tilletia laevis]KAE8246150.1 hypothetical protein A4X06_0g5154 [Tilletia controversa]